MPVRVEPGTDQLIDVATTLADAQGTAALTLHAVAHHAGQPLAAAQRAFGSRDRLVAALVQHLLTRRRAPAGPGPPVARLIGLAEQEWQVYQEHPWLVGVLASSRPPLVPAVLEVASASIEAFIALGLPPATALRRYLALSGYIQGMALLLYAEQREAAQSGTTYQSWWAGQARRLDRTGSRLRHAWLDEVTAGGPPEGLDVDTMFREGLPRVVAGLTDAEESGDASGAAPPPGEPPRVSRPG
ncbi:TetR/AcrR family transcriptional regulator [Micromonospora sp. NBC_01813]|uniref:TetR/AcrR family transcriptional regulator n=1 Tax=Micromonospora sp. NBC_01813 TaxID=2975988 RepID=UPI002DD8CB44|nr:TetR/AcrR family transcriptional regulator [Micromonospora sp. NBC_01813]WSA06283.1 TetR/AcrR family transcriptional regulator [Micromonospora sp. NBC_01813]